MYPWREKRKTKDKGRKVREEERVSMYTKVFAEHRAHTWCHTHIRHIRCCMRCAHNHLSRREALTESMVRHVAKHLEIFRDSGQREELKGWRKSGWLEGDSEGTAGRVVLLHRASSDGLIFPHAAYEQSLAKHASIGSAL